MKRFSIFILALTIGISIWADNSSAHIFMESNLTKHANIGLYVKNLNTGKVIESYRASNTIPPASVMKVLTTATCLELLGGDFRFETYLEYSGKIEKGILKGDLYVRGGGDPTLGNLHDGQGFLQTWVKKVQAAGIREIEGSIIADVSFFDGDALNPGWLWEDAGNYYAPCVSALSYMDNTMNIILQSGPIGTTANVQHTVPEVPGVQFDNHIRCTATDRDGAFVHGMPYNNMRYLTGSIPSNQGSFGVKGDIPNPGLLLVQHFQKRLEEAGIKTQQEPDYITENDRVVRTVVYTHHSAPLKDIIFITNQYSVNLYAEAMFRYLGSRLSVPCTIMNAEQVMRNCWRNRGVNISCNIIHDGCGLAPQDALSPESLAQLLTYMNGSNEKENFYNSLPVSGKSGTLQSLLSGTELEGKVHAKSGTISGTKNYAGYIEPKKGEKWIFIVMVNSAQCKARQVQPIIEKYLLDVYRRNK